MNNANAARRDAPARADTLDQAEARSTVSWLFLGGLSVLEFLVATTSILIKSNGGSYGLSGPRGCGKSWLMLKAIDQVRSMGGIGSWYPSPSEYDSMAFLSSLSDNFANEIERRFRRETKTQAIISVISNRMTCLIFSASQSCSYSC